MKNSAKTVFLKSLSLMLAALLLCVIFAGCSKNTTATADTGTKPQDSTSEQSSPAADTTEPEPKLSINEDMLSDIGLTYNQLTAKYGKLVSAIMVSAGVGYCFENGYGAYLWGSEQLDYGRELEPNEGYPIPRDENNVPIIEELQTPKEGEKCPQVILVKPEDFFKEAVFPISLTNLEHLQGIENFKNGKDGIATAYPYMATFVYNGYGIIIYHNEEDKIDETSRVDCYGYWDSES